MSEPNTFRMSRKTYVPQRKEYQEELQKSIMGLSIKLKNGNTLRESFSKKAEDLPIKRDTPKMFTEFFIIGADQTKLT